jgi:signal transduction histidine kinase
VIQAQPARKTRLDEDLAGDTRYPVDRFAMAQVFRNVFENAVDVTPTGEPVCVTAREYSNGSKQRELVISITDHGPGLTAEQQQRIFEPFFTTKAKGTGLGMAIASRIVQSHGGTISASSPRGARIEIRLPR